MEIHLKPLNILVYIVGNGDFDKYGNVFHTCGTCLCLLHAQYVSNPFYTIIWSLRSVKFYNEGWNWKWRYNGTWTEFHFC